MKTLDEAMEVLVLATDPAEDERKWANATNFGETVAASEDVFHFISSLAEYFEEEEKPVNLVEFGLSCFSAGVQVGVEMERP